MRLTSIKAVRYGALSGECLGDLSDTLTVVLGPNESGKSTLTALTRHVLYGYPDGRAKERGYMPSGGSRSAQLTFADEYGEWVVERVDGKNRGPVSVKALRGAERSGLLGELVAGVSEQSYRVVFGFGLDELAEIESGDKTDVVARLYAAGTGLAVNPMDARGKLEAMAAGLYAPRAQKPVVNALSAKLRELKVRIGALEAIAADYAGEQARLSELAGQLEPLREQRDALDARLIALEQDKTRLGAAAGEVEGVVGQLAEQDRAIRDIERAITMIDVDERILAAAPEIATVLDDASGFRAHVEAAGLADANAEEAQRRAAAFAVPEQAADNAENRAAVERWRDRLASLRMSVQRDEEVARQAEARRDALRQVVAAPVAAPATSRTLPIALAAITCVGGAVIAAAGLLQKHPVITVLGAIVMLAGIPSLIVAWLWRPPVAGGGQSLSADAAGAAANAQTARTLADSAVRDLDAALAEWREWLAARGLDAQGDDPVAVRALLDEAGERQRLLGEAQRYVATANREGDAAEAWVIRLVDCMRRYDETASQVPALSEAGMLAARAKHDLEMARAAEAERARLGRDVENAKTERERLSAQYEAARTLVAEISARNDLGAEVPLAQLTALVERTREERREGRESFDRVAQEHAALRGKLDNEGRGDEMARVRQEVESVRVEAADAADRYLTMALAVRLLDRARERYERERQPEVVRTAGRVFSAMTEGRYTDVRVPLDNGGISVITAAGDVCSTNKLSRGTAEQLYLALRVGLIGSLGAAGAALPVLMDDVVVNFDPQRRAGAVAAVAELAAMRQVLFFTCHPETASALVATVPGARLLSLDRCELR